MNKILAEPLLHFILIGIALFATYQWVSPGESIETEKEIVVSKGRIEQLATIFGKTWQRPPTADELKSLVDDYILEEIYYRQAKALGIDADDTVIRRRLRLKLEFLTDDSASLVQPSDQELTDYLVANADKFRQSPTYTFEQVYFNPQKHTQAEVAEELSFLREGKEVGDPSLLPPAFNDAHHQAVDGTFGIGFSVKLDGLKVGEWEGPVRSGLGLHLVKIESRTEGKLPELEQVRTIVQREWSNDKRLELRKLIDEGLLQQYEIKIEWPN